MLVRYILFMLMKYRILHWDQSHYLNSSLVIMQRSGISGTCCHRHFLFEWFFIYSSCVGWMVTMLDCICRMYCTISLELLLNNYVASLENEMQRYFQRNPSKLWLDCNNSSGPCQGVYIWWNAIIKNHLIDNLNSITLPIVYFQMQPGIRAMVKEGQVLMLWILIEESFL